MQHYGKLVALDYKVRIRPCTEEDYSCSQRKKKIPYFCASTSPELDVEKQELVSYKIIFTPVYLRNKPEQSVWQEDIEAWSRKNNLTYADLIMDRYAYYPTLIGAYDPTSMEVGSCYEPDEDSFNEDDRYKYDRCKGKVRVYETGLWCTSCHDYFENDIDDNLVYFLEKSVRMSKFPLQSILEIREKREPLPQDFKPEKYLRKLEKKAAKIEKVKQELHDWDAEAQRLLHEREKRRQMLLSCLN